MKIIESINGTYQYKLLNPITKGIELAKLAHAFLEVVRIPANPIDNKKNKEDILYKLFFVFSKKRDIQNGKTRENQQPA